MRRLVVIFFYEKEVTEPFEVMGDNNTTNPYNRPECEKKTFFLQIIIKLSIKLVQSQMEQTKNCRRFWTLKSLQKYKLSLSTVQFLD